MGGWQIVREPEGNVWRDLELRTCETSKIRGRADDADCANFPTNGVRARMRAASNSEKTRPDNPDVSFSRRSRGELMKIRDDISMCILFFSSTRGQA